MATYTTSKMGLRLRGGFGAPTGSRPRSAGGQHQPQGVAFSLLPRHCRAVGVLERPRSVAYGNSFCDSAVSTTDAVRRLRTAGAAPTASQHLVLSAPSEMLPPTLPNLHQLTEASYPIPGRAPSGSRVTGVSVPVKLRCTGGSRLQET